MTPDEKVDAFMPLWIGAYLADTLTFTTLQHGAYILLLMAYWRERAPLADDDEALRSIAKADRAEWKKLRPVLARKFRVGDGVWWHKRVEQELADAMKRKAGAVSKAKKAAEARWSKDGEQSSSNAPSIASGNPEAMPEDCPTSTPSSLRSDSEAKASDAADAPSSPDKSGGKTKPPPDPERQRLWSESIALIVSVDKIAESTARSFIGQLAKDYKDVIREALDAAIKAQPAEARSYLTATCKRLAGERNTVPSDAAEKHKAALEADAAHGADLTAEQRTERIARARAAVASATRTTEQAPTAEESHVDG